MILMRYKNMLRYVNQEPESRPEQITFTEENTVNIWALCQEDYNFLIVKIIT